MTAAVFSRPREHRILASLPLSRGRQDKLARKSVSRVMDQRHGFFLAMTSSLLDRVGRVDNDVDVNIENGQRGRHSPVKKGAPMAEYDFITYENIDDSRIARILLNRPDA